MSYVLNMVGGGGSLKNTDAILIVTVLHGATVTAAKSGKTLTPTLWTNADNNSLDCALFSIKSSLFDSQNAWTVTSVLGAQTITGTVVIDAAEQYEMFLADSVEILKADAFATTWAGVSSAVGDIFKNSNDRTFTRTTSEAVLLLNYYSSGTSYGYGVVSLLNSLQGTYTTYGDPTRAGLFTSPDGVEYYTYRQWAHVGGANPTYTVDGVAHNFERGTDFPYLDNSGVIQCSNSSRLSQFYAFIKRLNDLPH